jgi:hypothetical protein
MVLTLVLLGLPDPAHGQATNIHDAVQSLQEGVNLALGLPPGADSDQISGAFAELLALEVSTAPNGNPSGGLTFTFDSALGTFRRASPTFGPAFAERSLTSGARTLSVGVSALHSRYDAVAGQSIDGIVVAQSGGEARSTFAARLATDTTVVVGNYGVTDALDVGVVVPWIRTSLSGEVVLLGPGTRVPLQRLTVSGVGDIALLAKYRILPRNQGGLAAGLEIRVPSGDTRQSRGLGTTRSLMSLIWSRGGRIAPHANAGFEVWSKALTISPSANISARNQVKYAGGVEVHVTPKLTLLGDLVGRRVFGGGRLGYENVVFQAGPVAISTDLLVARPGGLHVVSAAPGFKWNVGRNALVSAHTLVTLANKGLRANVTPVLGFDWTF